MTVAGHNRTWLAVVGLGEDGLTALTPSARTLVETAEVLVGGARHHALVPDHPGERLTWRVPLRDTMADIAARRGRRVTVLATGDPMAYGIGTTLARHFAPEEMLVLPAPGAFSLAAARLGWALSDIGCLTLHGRPSALLAPWLTPGARLLLLADDGGTAAQVAAYLRASGWGPSRIAALAHMGGPGESRREAIAEDWRDEATPDFVTLAITCLPGPGARPLARVPGLPDDAFVHDGQLTKRAVRAATLARLQPMPGQHLWDLGAGSGSIAIEWLRAVQTADGRGATAVAVERDAARRALIARNAASLGTPFLDIVAGDSEDVLGRLAPPDAIFIGGGISAAIVECAIARLKPGGRIVANTVSTEGEAIMLAAQARHGGDLVRLAVSEAGTAGGRTVWRALAPVTQWTLAKP